MGRKRKFRGLEEELYLLEDDPDHEFRWQTKDGRIIKVKDMSDDHIKNTIRMLERVQIHRSGEGYSFLNFLKGEMAIECCEREIQQEEDFYDELIGVFKCELKERGKNETN